MKRSRQNGAAARLAVILTLAWPAADCFAAPPQCDWKGERDPFTGEDTRHVYASYWLGTVSYLFFPRKGETVPAEVRVKYSGETTREWTAPVRLLLLDDSVVDLTPKAPVVGSVRTADGAVTTTFEIPMEVPVADAVRIYKAGGVKRVRFDFPDGADFDQTFKAKDHSDLAVLAWCSVNGAKSK